MNKGLTLLNCGYCLVNKVPFEAYEKQGGTHGIHGMSRDCLETLQSLYEQLRGKAI